MPASADLSAIPQDERNPLTPEKVALGQQLFHDPGMGSSSVAGMKGTYSCASCHSSRFGFQAGVRQGIGRGGSGVANRTAQDGVSLDDVDTQAIRTPSSMNVAWQRNMLWNGQFGAFGANAGTEKQWLDGTPRIRNELGYDGVETQAIAGQFVHELRNISPRYTAMFDRAFPGWPEESRYGPVTAGLAIAAFERAVMSNQAPWQRWLSGEKSAMTVMEKQGALLFMTKAGCSRCHSGPALNSETFHALGLGDMPGRPGAGIPGERFGRGGFTARESDLYKFKTPQLYNLNDSPYLGHGGTVRSVRAMVEYKNLAVRENQDVPARDLSPEFTPLGLSAGEVEALTAFVETALRDAKLARYEPAFVADEGGCIISGDILSRREMACAGGDRR
ncbi:cytochrome c peroxidase [Ottowia sp.]|uniref:cytochrome-c peroxidase n=1 Tax=Ottowia sp. TaxID=1898956 RepID=UPI0025DE7435|nr:cytochrome c peroxidase [Ottowia sp.]